MPKKDREPLELSEDELEREAQTPYVTRTFKRIGLMIIDPIRAMRFVGYAPDWAIVIVILGLVMGFNYLQYYMLFKYKMDVPAAFHSAVIDGVTTFIINWYFSGSFVATGISILIGLGIIAGLTRALGGVGTIKQTAIGVFYANIGRVLVTTVMLIMILATPAVTTPVETAGTGKATFIFDTPSGKINSTMSIIFNYTIPPDSSTEPLPDVSSTRVIGRADLTLRVWYYVSIDGEAMIFPTLDGEVNNRTSLSVNYSSIIKEGYVQINELSEKDIIVIDWSTPKNVSTTKKANIEGKVSLPINLTYIIPGEDNSTLPVWASWIYDPTTRQKVLVFKIPLQASFIITDFRGRKIEKVVNTVAFFNVTQVPQGQYFSRIFFSGPTTLIFGSLGYIALIWQALLFAVLARTIHELSWPKSAACSITYLAVVLLIGMI
ncbi:MAG: hypothetical protein ACUVTL_09290 [Thermoproteota archaeon]